MAKSLLLLGSVTAFCYLVENLLQLTGNEIDRYMFLQRVASLEHGWAFWGYLIGTGGIVQLLWSVKNRQKIWMVVGVASIVLFCQWISRYLLVVVTLVNPT